jgi:hypothetical protein
MHRIKKQLVTSMYKLPIKMTPVELAYVFSTKVKQMQLYATLLDLANRSIVIMHNKNGKTTIEHGPKVSDDLTSFEILLLNQFKDKSGPVDIDLVLNGFTSNEVKNGVKISGSRQYVFWWLLRDTLRQREIVQRHLSKRYLKMLLSFGGLGSMIVSVVSVFAIRFIQMVNIGEVDVQRLIETIFSGLSFWAITLIPILFVGFFLLKYRGKMLGRHWIMTAKYRRYLGQIDAFREFVRLTHKDKLRFESSELRKESIALTRPFAIACGYIKK